MEQQTGIGLALEKFENSPTKLANAIGGTVLRQHVEHWLKAGRVPADKAPDVEAATGISVEMLCPETNWSVVRGIPAPASAAPSQPVAKAQNEALEDAAQPVLIVPGDRRHESHLPDADLERRATKPTQKA